MSVNGSVNRIVTGSGVIFAGTLIGLLFDIIFKRLFTSYLSPEDFGIYSLALTVISITGAVATLGLGDGVARYIAYFRGRNEDYKIHELITSAAVMGLTASVLAMLVSPVLFKHLAANGFDIQGKILDVIKIMALVISVTILLNVTVAVYRGFDRTNVNVYFYNLVRPLSLLVFASAAMFFHLSFHGIVFNAAFIILYFAVILYARILDENELDIIGEIRKEIWSYIGIRMPHLFCFNLSGH